MTARALTLPILGISLLIRARLRSRLARRAARRRDKEELKRLGRTGGCVVTQHLWYFSWSDGFPVPVVHALLHGVFKSLVRFMLRDAPPGANSDTFVSAAARKIILERGTHIIATNDIGRAYKCVFKHLGLYTFEDLKNLALVYGKYLFRGDVLPPTLRTMYNNVCTAIEHYLTFGNFNSDARQRAHGALLSFAKKVGLGTAVAWPSAVAPAASCLGPGGAHSSTHSGHALSLTAH